MNNLNKTISALLLSNIFHESPYVVNYNNLKLRKSKIKNVGSNFILSYNSASIAYSSIKNTLDVSIIFLTNQFWTSKVIPSASSYFKHCTFSNCNSGAIEVNSEAVDLTIAHCSFANCVVPAPFNNRSSKGGSIRVNKANKVYIKMVETISCTAYYGKSIYINSNHAKLHHILVALITPENKGSRPVHLEECQFEEKNINLTRNAIEYGAVFATADKNAKGTMRFIETSACRGNSVFFIPDASVDVYRDIVFNNVNLSNDSDSRVFELNEGGVAERLYMNNIDYSKGVLFASNKRNLVITESVIAFCPKEAITTKVTVGESCVFSETEPFGFEDNDWYPDCPTKKVRAPARIVKMALLIEVNLNLIS